MVEGDVAHVVQARHDHTGDPERDNVACGDQHARGIPRLQVLRFIRPAQRGMRPQRRGEPRVQHIRILHESLRLELLLDLGMSRRDANVIEAAVFFNNGAHDDLGAADFEGLERINGRLR